METPKIQDLLQQEVDRRQFFKHVGAGAIVLLGADRIINGLKSDPKVIRKQGYGSSSYGDR